MTPKVHIFAENDIRLWGLSGRERLMRALARIGIRDNVTDLAILTPEEPVLILRGDHIYDARLLRELAGNPGTVLAPDASGGRPVAALVPGHLAHDARRVLAGEEGRERLEGLRLATPETLAPTYLQELRKIDTPYLLEVRQDNRAALEKRLFSGSYKGVTDLVTKWLWPLPARWATRFCADRGIRPNHVTSLSLLLVVLAYFLFEHGHFWIGLVAAWLMTFLDTVDGKLARVTVTSTAFGNIFDHAIDLISPPLWYIAWGLGLASFEPGIPGLTLEATFWLILVGYVAGRLVEGIFKKWLEPSGIFCWRPVDSYFRLITGRRNPNLILLTLFLAGGRPDLGLVAVALWTFASSIFLVWRLVKGWRLSRQDGPLRSWFLDIDPTNPRPSLTERCFSNLDR